VLSASRTDTAHRYRFPQASWNSLTANSPESARVYRATIVRRSAADERDTDDSDNRSHARFQIEAGSFGCCQLR
jgi:hypothetical protein